MITRTARWVLLAACTFGLILPLGSFLLGYRFLPSQEYVEASWPIACLTAFCTATCMGCLLWMPSDISRAVKANKFEQGVMLVMAGWIGLNSISTGLPFVRALITSETVSLPYQVGSGLDIKCDDSITFGGLPIFFNSLCGLEVEIRSTIEKGDVLFLKGRGTSWGIFPALIFQEVVSIAPPDADSYQ